MSEKYEIKWATVANQFTELNSLNDVTISTLTDGDQMIYNAALGRWTNSSYQPGSLQSIYGTTEGIHAVSWGGVSNRPMRVGFYNNKAWVEIMYSMNSFETAPWDYWINSSTNGIQSYNLLNNGLNYDSGTSSVLIVPEIMTNLLITAKPSKTSYIDSASSMDCSHMSSTNRNTFIDYFTGVIPGFELLDTFGISGGVGNFDTHLGYRNGGIQTDEWLIQDSIEGSSIGAPLWGYRSSGANKGAIAHGNPISTSNVLSVWATNY
jgi:hypothetical protein